MSSVSNQATIEILDHVASELTYLPTGEQRKAKSAFWTRFNENPICEPQDITAAIALRFSGDSRITKWWSQDGFREWFQNRDEFRQRMEYLSNLAMDSLENILIDPRANQAAKVSAAKLIMEVSRKMPSKSATEQYLDEQISKMDKKQLQEYIQKSLRSLQPAAPEEAPTEDRS